MTTRRKGDAIQERQDALNLPPATRDPARTVSLTSGACPTGCALTVTGRLDSCVAAAVRSDSSTGAEGVGATSTSVAERQAQGTRERRELTAAPTYNNTEQVHGKQQVYVEMK